MHTGVKTQSVNHRAMEDIVYAHEAVTRRNEQQEANVKCGEMKRYDVRLLIRTSHQDVVSPVEEMNNMLHWERTDSTAVLTISS